jgi:hypothetical protein
MNFLIKVVLIAVLFSFTLVSSSQDTSSVLLKELKGEYQGKTRKGLANGKGEAKGIDTYKGNFKNGLPHGVGRYVWSTGEIYVGEWYKGKPSGQGTYIFKTENGDSSLVGVWKDGVFIGLPSKAPIVNRYYNVDSFTFRNNEGPLNRVLIDFTQNGNLNTRIENLMLTTSNGTRTSSGQLVGFQNITFPVTITARYDTYNKMGTQKINAFIEFTIYEKGDWLVIVKN